MILENNYNYVWGIFDFSSTPPNKRDVSKADNEIYQFYPFEHGGDIFTVDTDLWESKIPIEESFYPDLNFIESNIKKSTVNENKSIELIAFYSNSIVPTIDANNDITINKLPDYLYEALSSNYEWIGFDIVDVTGVSGLVNIGYEMSQLKKIQKSHIKMTRWGLVYDENQAMAFAQIISEYSPEHAPFLPMEIWMKKI